MIDTKDWDALVQKHLDGQTTPEEAEALSAGIVGDTDLRASYLKAAQVHGALADETLAVELEPEPVPRPEPRSSNWRVVWPRQIAAGLLAGVVIGLLGAGMVWAVGAPKAVARACSIAHGDFESLPVGRIPNRFPAGFGEWGGDPAEVVSRDGKQELRLLQTANIAGLANGPAAACDVFQLVDLSTLRQQGTIDTEFSLELVAHFRRDASNADSATPRLRGVCRLYLFDAALESIGKAWPLAVHDAIASGSKAVKLVPGQESTKVSASCILVPEASVAMIHLSANPGLANQGPTALGDCFVDDVRLTLTSRPRLPIKVVHRLLDGVEGF
jgi:hypothetical protein